MDGEYTAVAYSTTTGRVIYEIPLKAPPSWSARINDPGTWEIEVPLGREKTLREAREWCVRWRFSVAIMYGDTVCQAGPVVSYSLQKESRSLKVVGAGLWELLNRRLQHNGSWNPNLYPITHTTADLYITDSLPNIARTLVHNGTTWVNRSGSGLPLDLPALLPGGGTNVRVYRGYDLAMVGERLQELTQVDEGPDVLFQPRLTISGSSRQIRHTMLIGNPLLTQPGVPLLFDLSSSLTDMDIVGDGSNLATSAWVKGSGSESGQLYGYATATSLIDAGYPVLDLVDTNHTSATEQATLASWAAADIDLFGSQPEQWSATVLADKEPRLGIYAPGHFADYQVGDHFWLANGRYSFRIIGISHSSGNERGTVNHQLQAVGNN